MSQHPHRRTYVVIVYPSSYVLARLPYSWLPVLQQRVEGALGPDDEVAEEIATGSREELLEFPGIEEKHLAHLDQVAPLKQVYLPR